MGLLKREFVFYFLIKIKIKTANQIAYQIFSNCIERLGHKKQKQKQKQKRNKTKQSNNKQTKNNQGKNKQIKNGNNSALHEPLSEEWIGRRS